MQVIGPAVADVADDDVAADRRRRLGGAAHAALALARRARRGEDLLVGVLEGGQQHLLGTSSTIERARRRAAPCRRGPANIGCCKQVLAHRLRWPGRRPPRRPRSRPCRRTGAPAAYSPRSSCRDSTPCRRAKASSLPVRTMPVVVQAAMSRRTLSNVAPADVERADQLGEAGRVGPWPPRRSGSACSTSRHERLVDQPAEAAGGRRESGR